MSRGCKNIRGQSWRLIRNCRLSQIRDWCAWHTFVDLQLWPLIFLQPLDLQECTVPHLKDMIHISLEPETQGCGVTFNMGYVGSNYAYFISYRGKWVYLFLCKCSLCIDYTLFEITSNKPRHSLFQIHCNVPESDACVPIRTIDYHTGFSNSNAHLVLEYITL